MLNSKTRQQKTFPADRKTISERSQDVFEALNRTDTSTDLSPHEELLLLRLVKAIPTDFLRANHALIFGTKKHGTCACGVCKTCKNRIKTRNNRERMRMIDPENPFGVSKEEIPTNNPDGRKKLAIISEYQALLDEMKKAERHNDRIRLGRQMGLLRKQFESVS